MSGDSSAWSQISKILFLTRNQQLRTAFFAGVSFSAAILASEGKPYATHSDYRPASFDGSNDFRILVLIFVF